MFIMLHSVASPPLLPAVSIELNTSRRLMSKDVPLSDTLVDCQP
jgi:hypothetical protein